MAVTMNVGKQIRQIRKLKLFSQEVLSEQVGIDPKSLGRIEKGDYYPALDTLHRLSLALEVPMHEFFPATTEKKTALSTEDGIRHFLVDFLYQADQMQLISLYKTALKLG